MFIFLDFIKEEENILLPLLVLNDVRVFRRMLYASIIPAVKKAGRGVRTLLLVHPTRSEMVQEFCWERLSWTRLDFLHPQTR